MHNDPLISRPTRRGRIGVWLLLVLVVYAAGLCTDISEPWVGMHDWNGAFFSQLARNLLRYPASVHHWMPLVAVGSQPPPPAECSIYATHPPALVWLLAASFRTLGESEITARLVPILASLASLALLVRLVRRAHGRDIALFAGAIYAVMPMSVYFGRMVNHEAVCLFCMLGATTAWSVVCDARSTARTRRWAAAGWAAAIILGIWVDWPVLLFAVLFCAYVLHTLRLRRIAPRAAVAATGVVVLAASSMIVFLVHAGLGGRWGALGAVFLSRAGTGNDAGPHLQIPTHGPWAFAVTNLSWPVLVCGAVGLFLAVRTALLRRAAPHTEPRAAVDEGCRVAKAGLMLVALTGLVWLVVFWRQYERHNYWMFYLGPAAAVLAAQTFATVQRRLAGRRRVIVYGCLAGLLVITGAFEIRGVRDCFDRTYPDLLNGVREWEGLHARTIPGDRLLLYRDAIREESHGGYCFRNIVPPQLAYYLDRPFDIEPDVGRVPLAAETHRLFVLPIADAVSQGGSLRDLRARYREELLEGSVVFHLHRFRTASRPASEAAGNP